MTTPESITVSLEWAKKLQEAGWPQEQSWFWWWNADLLGWSLESSEYELASFREAYGDDLEMLAAPTAEEILRRLKNWTASEFLLPTPPEAKEDVYTGYCVHVKKLYDDKGEYGRVETGTTLANAAAAMFCYLAKHKLIH